MVAKYTVEIDGGSPPQRLDKKFDEHRRKREWRRMKANMVRYKKIQEITETLIDLGEPIPEASRLLWLDQDVGYAVCDDCYQKNKQQEWSEFEEEAVPSETKESLHKLISDGTPCMFCRHYRVDELHSKITEEVEIKVVFDSGKVISDNSAGANVWGLERSRTHPLDPPTPTGVGLPPSIDHAGQS